MRGKRINQALVLKLPTRWTLRKLKRRASEVSLRVAERSERVYFLIGAETRVGTLGICISGARRCNFRAFGFHSGFYANTRSLPASLFFLWRLAWPQRPSDSAHSIPCCCGPLRLLIPTSC